MYIVYVSFHPFQKPTNPQCFRKIVIYQRDKSRKLNKINDLVQHLKEKLGDSWIIDTLMHSELRSILKIFMI